MPIRDSREVVLLFTDIESSTRLWETYPEEMKQALELHDSILRDAIERSGGTVVKSTGDGVMAVFDPGPASLEASVEILQDLASAEWGPTGPLRIRVGIHQGPAQVRGKDFFGPTVNRAARLMGAGHGGQILVSEAATGASSLPEGLSLQDKGLHRLRDLSEPVQVYQLQGPELPRDFPALNTLDTAPNNLPTLASTFFGRAGELDDIRTHIRSGTRLTTLTGPGGTGKTRLALQAAADQTPYFRHGVFFVDLSTEIEPEESFANVARVLGVDAAGDETALDTLCERLSDRRLLLILDNLEQIAGFGPGLARLLEAAPAVTVLATSRQPVGIRGEQLYPIQPLSLPPVGATLSEMNESEAGQLFADRAATAMHGFETSEEHVSEAVSIVRRLDGLPLALELAAARLRLFSLQELRERLEERLDVLRGGAHDLPERQQTLENTIAWSFDLLEQPEMQLLQIMSVFSDATITDLEDVGRVCGLEGDILDDLSSLVDKSLVRATRTETATRYGLLQTIREFTVNRLSLTPNVADSIRAAHARHFTRRALELEESLDVLVPEIENLQLAWSRWMEGNDVDRLHELLGPLWRMYDSEGWYQGAMALAEDMLDALELQPASEEKTREQIALQASLARARLLVHGYGAESERAFAEILEAAEASGEAPRLFPILRSLASFYLLTGRVEEPKRIGKELLEIASREDDNTDMIVDAAFVYGSSTAFTNEVEEGLQYLDKAIERFDPSRMRSNRFRLGPHSGVIAQTTSGFLDFYRGLPEQAASKMDKALLDARELGHSYTLAYALFHVAYFRFMTQDVAALTEPATELLAVANQYDYQIWRALAMVLLSVVTAFTEDPKEGLAEAERSITLYEELDTPPVFWSLLLHVKAVVALNAGEADLALSLIDESVSSTRSGMETMIGGMLLTKGEILAALGRVEEATGVWNVVHDEALDFEASTIVLGAALRLARTDPSPASVRRLREVYDGFTEGFDLPEMKAAEAILGDDG